MRKIIFLAAAGALCTMQLGLTGCTDMDGDGIDNVEWGGSTNPESTSYRNPVWEPSLEGGTVIVTPNNFVAIGGETQWAVGVDYCCPTILSTNMMQWTTNQQVAFSAANRPAWITGRINSLSADLITETTKVTITTTTTETDEETGQETTTTTSKEEDRSASRYFMVYSTDKDNAIGVASSAAAQGPYVDHGCLLKASDLGVGTLADPFIVAYGNNDIYIGYTTDNGSYVRKIEFPFTVDATSYAMTINTSGLPVLGDATKVSSASFSNIALFRDADGNYMIFGDVDGGVNYAVASAPTGPYTAGSGSLLSSNGDTFIEGGNGYENPCNVMRIIPSSNGNCYVAFNATLTETPAMPSGYAREPMMVNPFKISGGKVSAAIKVNSGWTSPRFVR
jgi:hypothetical protein